MSMKTETTWYKIPVPGKYEINNKYQVRNARTGRVLKVFSNCPTNVPIQNKSYSIAWLAHMVGLPRPTMYRSKCRSLEMTPCKDGVAYWFPSRSDAARYIGCDTQNITGHRFTVRGWKRYATESLHSVAPCTCATSQPKIPNQLANG